MEHIERLYAALFGTKDKVNPAVQVLAHVVGLQRLPVFREVLGRGACPLWQLDIIYALLVRADTKVKAQLVSQESWVVHVELRDELLYIARVVQRRLPLFLYAFEQAVWVVVAATLELDHPLRVLPY